MTNHAAIYPAKTAFLTQDPQDTWIHASDTSHAASVSHPEESQAWNPLYPSNCWTQWDLNITQKDSVFWHGRMERSHTSWIIKNWSCLIAVRHSVPHNVSGRECLQTEKPSWEWKQCILISEGVWEAIRILLSFYTSMTNTYINKAIWKAHISCTFLSNISTSNIGLLSGEVYFIFQTYHGPTVTGYLPVCPKWRSEEGTRNNVWDATSIQVFFENRQTANR